MEDRQGLTIDKKESLVLFQINVSCLEPCHCM